VVTQALKGLGTGYKRQHTGRGGMAMCKLMCKDALFAICTAHSPGQRRKQCQMQQALAGNMMQKVHVDLVGAFPTSKRGYKYLLTAICGFTKYLVCVPIRDKVSATVAEDLMKHLYLVYGLPEIFIHDQGGEFWSDVMMRLAALLDIQPSKITSHRPNSNGVVERVHATLHSMF